MTKETQKAIRKAFIIALSHINIMQSENGLRAAIDPEFARNNVTKQLLLVELSEEMKKGREDFEQEVRNVNHN